MNVFLLVWYISHVAPCQFILNALHLASVFHEKATFRMCVLETHPMTNAKKCKLVSKVFFFNTVSGNPVTFLHASIHFSDYCRGAENPFKDVLSVPSLCLKWFP